MGWGSPVAGGGPEVGRVAWGRAAAQRVRASREGAGDWNEGRSDPADGWLPRRRGASSRGTAGALSGMIGVAR